jgi:hypothetical protein
MSEKVLITPTKIMITSEKGGMYLLSFHKVMVLYKKRRYERVKHCCTILYGSTAFFPDYNDMVKASESIARSFGYFFGRR